MWGTLLTAAAVTIAGGMDRITVAVGETVYVPAQGASRHVIHGPPVARIAYEASRFAIEGVQPGVAEIFAWTDSGLRVIVVDVPPPVRRSVPSEPSAFIPSKADPRWALIRSSSVRLGMALKQDPRGTAFTHLQDGKLRLTLEPWEIEGGLRHAAGDARPWRGSARLAHDWFFLEGGEMGLSLLPGGAGRVPTLGGGAGVRWRGGEFALQIGKALERSYGGEVRAPGVVAGRLDLRPLGWNLKSAGGLLGAGSGFKPGEGARAMGGFQVDSRYLGWLSWRAAGSVSGDSLAGEIKATARFAEDFTFSLEAAGTQAGFYRPENDLLAPSYLGTRATFGAALADGVGLAVTGGINNTHHLLQRATVDVTHVPLGGLFTVTVGPLRFSLRGQSALRWVNEDFDHLTQAGGSVGLHQSFGDLGTAQLGLELVRSSAGGRSFTRVTPLFGLSGRDQGLSWNLRGTYAAQTSALGDGTLAGTASLGRALGPVTLLATLGAVLPVGGANGASLSTAATAEWQAARDQRLRLSIQGGRGPTLTGQVSYEWTAIGEPPPVVRWLGQGAISGRLCIDADGDGECGPDDPPLAGRDVLLADGRRATTGWDGRYGFMLLEPGTYRLTVEADDKLDGGRYIAPKMRSVDVPALGTGTADFPFQEAGGVTGRIVELSGVGVGPARLTLQGGPRPREAYADPSGAFRFEHLAPGTYTVSLDPASLPAGYKAEPRTSATVQVAVGSWGETSFRVRALRAVAGLVFADLDLDGRRGPREPPVSRVLVNCGPTNAAFAGEDGQYICRDIPPGELDLSVEPASLSSSWLSERVRVISSVRAGTISADVPLAPWAPTGGRLFEELGDVFAPSSDVVRNGERKLLVRLGELLDRHPGKQLRVVAGVRPGESGGRRLAERRAAAVERLLESGRDRVRTSTVQGPGVPLLQIFVLPDAT